MAKRIIRKLKGPKVVEDIEEDRVDSPLVMWPTKKVSFSPDSMVVGVNQYDESKEFIKPPRGPFEITSFDKGGFTVELTGPDSDNKAGQVVLIAEKINQKEELNDSKEIHPKG